MIDQIIINTSTETARQAIVNCKPTASPMLYTVERVFDNTLTNKLKEYLTQEQINWSINQNTSPMRRSLAWDQDTIIEEIHEVGNNLTELIVQKFFKHPLNFLGINVWKDQSQFEMEWHSDNPIINVALQVYMFDLPTTFGTSFLIDEKETLIPHVHNTGYIAITKTQPGIVHRPTTVVAPGVTRYSIYAIWSLTKKIIEEEKTTC